MNEREHQLESAWTRLGVLFNVEPAAATPDPERLLLQTAANLSANSRLLDLAATWLVRHGSMVARHRLRRLAVGQLPRSLQPRLGLLIASAVALGAEPELKIIAAVCQPAEASEHGPLADVHRDRGPLADLAFRHASDLSRVWGVWAPPVRLRDEAIRPAGWVIDANPDLRERALRRGDLRCSIVESLRRDAGGCVRSEMELARLVGASRAAVRKALSALLAEGDVTIESAAGNQRDHQVRLRAAA